LTMPLCVSSIIRHSSVRRQRHPMAQHWMTVTTVSRLCQRPLVDCKVGSHRLFSSLGLLLTLTGIFLADANQIRLQCRNNTDQSWQRLPLKILKLFGWLVDQYLTFCAAKVFLLMGMHAVQRYARVRPNARSFATEGQPSIFGDRFHGFAEYSDGVVVRIAIVACQAVSQW